MESPTTTTNSLAIASLVIGILGWPLTCCYGVGMPLGVVALVIGLIALRQIKASPSQQEGKEMAIAGSILGGISIITGVMIVLTIGSLTLLGPQIGDVFSKINESLITPSP